MFTAIIITTLAAQAPADLPTIIVDRDNIEITQSCVIQIGANPIVDADGNGVIHITKPGIRVDFNNQHLHGAAADQTPDTFTGTGIRITAKDVTLSNTIVSGFKVGIHAVDADGLHVHHCDVSNNFHQRLKSTPRAEDASDWLWPHANDDNEWITNYGAGVCIEDSAFVRVHDIRARKTQNGIILDRVNESKVYDCDCSFLSGWGLAMWRSNKNVISRNAFDFCVRGYSHGVYNRGQDSAGILMFEQCSRNVIAENSATHCGDGFFGFAGKEALGEVNFIHQDWNRGRGCNQNQFFKNDFSYAVAHGLELTFSFSNHVQQNRFVENAICGIWGGYSQNLVIVSNHFEANGAMPYGSEGGGINIEHGSSNWIYDNYFTRDSCAVSLWWDEDEGIAKLPWALANGVESNRNWIAENTFESEHVAMRLRATHRTQGFGNKMTNVWQEIDSDEVSGQSIEMRVGGMIAVPGLKPYEAMGCNDPFSARAHLGGRENIIMTEWGPWDHESPLLQFVEHFDHADRYRVLGVNAMPAADSIRATGNVFVDVIDDRIHVSPRATDTLIPYTISFDVDGQPLSANGTLTGGMWEVWTFKSACDPREDAERWRREGEADHHMLTADRIDFRFGGGGMTEVRGLPVKLPRDHFGVIVTRKLKFPPGKWRMNTTSDDGIRVWMDDQLVIDDWTWHAPKEHAYEFELNEAREVDLRVEYFELDGYAILALDIESDS